MSTTTTLARSRGKEPAPVTAKPGPRLDIQGLRAIAVLAVVANHLWSWPAGGFVGVDVFFVVSGFLITGLLIRERAGTGRISFADFYRRRIRRIVPAAAATIAVTVLATYLIVSADRASEVGRDGLWAFFFAANWHFAAIGTDYFQNDSVSPLQHFWSLSVEEQFYLVWPIVILVTWRLARGNRHTTRILFAVIGLLCAASFSYSLWHTAEQPTLAYFSTFDRAWELGVGAMLAIARPALARMAKAPSYILGWLGLAGIVTSLFVVTAESNFPSPWAALPVLSTAAVIAAGVRGPQPYLYPLVNPVARWFGDISYSLYLWHFPVVILGLYFYPDRGVAYSVWSMVIMLALSAVSFYLIEEPIRHSSWLEPKAKKRRGRPRAGVDRRLQLGWVGVLVVVTGVLCVITLRPVDAPTSAYVPALSDDPEQTKLSLEEQQTERVEASLRQDAFPVEFRPAVDALGFDKWYDRMSETYCIDVDESNSEACRFGGDGDKTAVVFGDSYAMSWFPGIDTALGDRGWQVQQITMQQCPTWDVSVFWSGGSAYPECDAFRDWAVETINQMQPDLVVVGSAHWLSGRLADGAEGDEAMGKIQDGLVKTLRELKPSGARVVVLGPPPRSGDLTECVTRFAEPNDCAEELESSWVLVTDAEEAAADAAGVGYINPEPWFCFEGRCPGFVGKTAVTVDGGHLTMEYSQELAPLLAERLLGRRAG